VSVELRRLRVAGTLLAAGGLALLVILFFVDWFGGGVSGLPSGSHIEGVNVSATGWETFTSSRWIWLVAALVALAAAAALAAGRRFDGPLRPAALAAGLGALSCGLIVYRIAHHPSATVNLGTLHTSYGIRIGIWLGLIAALAITVGGYLQAETEARPPVEAAETAPQQFSGLALSQPESSPRERRSEDGP
jgi:hypothetical protein